MQIAKGGGRNADISPRSASPLISFLDASDVEESSPSSNLVDNMLNKVAEYVEPAASKTTEIIDALNKVVVGSDSVAEDSKPRRKSFIDALNQVSSSSHKSVDDDSLSVTDLEEVKENKPTVDHRRFKFSSKDITNILQESLSTRLMTSDKHEDMSSSDTLLLPSTSTRVEPSYRETLASIFELMDDMERAIHQFELTGTAQSLPDSPRQSGEVLKSKSEKLLHRLMNKSPIHKRQEQMRSRLAVPKESAKLIAKMAIQLDRLKNARIGSRDDCGNDVLNSARDSVFEEAAIIPSPKQSESRRSSLPPATVSDSPTLVVPPTMATAHAMDPVTIESPSRVTPPPCRLPEPPKVVSEDLGGLGRLSPPEIIELGTEVGGPSDTSSVEDELFFAAAKNTANKKQKRPWKAPEVEQKVGEDVAKVVVENASPSRTRTLSPKHYCVKCSRLLSYSPRRIRDAVLDRLLREEALRWRRCQACIERMFPSLFDVLLKRIVDTEGLIAFEEGELLYELSGLSEIPIRWEYKGAKNEYVSVLHLVLFELATNKDELKRIESGADLRNAIEKQRIKFVGDFDSQLPRIMKSVCQLQVDQHPLLAHLLNKYHDVILHCPEKGPEVFGIGWVHPIIGACWSEIVGQMSIDRNAANSEKES